MLGCKKETPKVIPTITALAITNITANSATAGGEVTSDGGDPVTVRGVCWSSTNAIPTISDSKTTDGTGLGIFSSSISGLAAGTSYNIRAYATNTVGTAYYSQAPFKTLALAPILTTIDISSITSTSFNSGGNITNDGGSPVTSRGVCWSTNQNPTIADNKTNDGIGIGNFTSSIIGLMPGITYYFRAYATNSIGTNYGNQYSTKTLATLPTLSTTTLTNITTITALSGGNITSDGGGSILACGVCWSTILNPTINDNKTTDGALVGNYTSTITGLTAGKTYYVRAYATNSAGTAYGNQLTLIAATTSPLVNTFSTFTFITSLSAIGGGTIMSDGGSSITERGVCWSTKENPTISDLKTSESAGTGIFTSNITGLVIGETYYFRAYASNSNGTSYGNQVIIKLSDEIFLSSTGHYYQFIARPMITWSAAKLEAESMKYNGLQGYLATITTEKENEFIQQKVRGTAWIGASDQSVEGEWRWVSGPEGLEDNGKGRLFWRGTGYQAKANPSNYGPVNGAYHNWNKWDTPYISTLSITTWEPNNLSGSENFAHITFFPYNPNESLKWNDAIHDVGTFGEYTIAGYIVEYGGL